MTVVYSKPNCPYCEKAKALLTKHNIEFELRDAVEEREALIALVEAETGMTPRSVPQIWLRGKYVGGYDDLVEELS